MMSFKNQRSHPKSQLRRQFDDGAGFFFMAAMLYYGSDFVSLPSNHAVAHDAPVPAMA
jgi:hypothetical protein